MNIYFLLLLCLLGNIGFINTFLFAIQKGQILQSYNRVVLGKLLRKETLFHTYLAKMLGLCDRCFAFWNCVVVYCCIFVPLSMYFGSSFVYWVHFIVGFWYVCIGNVVSLVLIKTLR